MRRITGIKYLLPVLAIALGLVCGAKASAQTPDEIIDLHIKALGGLDAINAVKSIQRKGDASLTGMSGDMKGTVESIIVPGKKSYQHMEFDMFTQKSGYNGTDVWIEDMMQGLRKVEGPEARQAITRADIDPLVALKLKPVPGIELSKLDDETVNDSEQYVIQASVMGAPAAKVYVDKKTHMITRMTVTQDNPQMGGEITIAVSVSGYEDHGGLMLPKTQKMDIGDGMIEIEMTYNETKVNEELDHAIFDMPKPETP